MKTQDLITALSADLHPTAGAERILPAALAAATLVCGGIFLALAGVRPDLTQALATTEVFLKQIFPPILAAGSLGLVLRLARPGARAGPWPWVLATVGALVLGAMAVQFVLLPVPAWPAALNGHSRFVCLSMIPLISVPILVAAFAVLKRGAPTRPRLCGAAAGLMSASAATTAYAFFCTDDNPLFWGTWYSAAILIVVLAGFCAGGRYLRW